MRLVNVHTLKLERFDNLKPHYAIASHRWITGSESSFQDVVQAGRDLDDSPGYQKIQHFAAFVRNHLRDVNYLWIDTCCIDKTSSEELSEAITAMYKWYAGAAICLAFLNDVPDITPPVRDGAERLQNSVWFTRGWTLQELLAPRLVVFLSATWAVLGHKAQDSDDVASPLDDLGPKLNNEIATITGIPSIVIAQPERRKSLTIEERLSWISNRTTTRPEDLAYCLLGLFDVSMPLLYEEGQKSAQRRLKRAIVDAASEDLTLNALSIKTLSLTNNEEPSKLTSAPPSSTVPFLRDPAFVHRPELDSLAQKLSNGGSRVALTGLGGVGKSQLAIEYCYQLRERQPNKWVLWIHAGSETRYEGSLRTLAYDLRLPGYQDAEVEICELVYHWLRDRRNGEWLLVLDNADDAEFLFTPPPPSAGKDRQLGQTSHPSRTRLELLPICAHGSILVTSRYQAIAARIVDDQSLVPVHTMASEEAVDLLRSKLGMEPVHDDIAAVTRLAARLDHMPLALAQAAAYIKQRGRRCSIDQYLAKLDQNRKSTSKLLASASSSVVALRRNDDAENSILQTWQISFEHVRSVRPSAADLISLMSFFDNQSIPEVVLRTGPHANPPATDTAPPATDTVDDDSSSDSSSDGDKEEAFELDIATLLEYDFISVASSGTDLKMHSLVQFAVQKWLLESSPSQYEQWMAQCIRNLDAILPSGDYVNWAQYDLLYPHARLMLKLTLPAAAREVNIQRLSILFRAADFALDKGMVSDAELLATYCKTEGERVLGNEDTDTLRSTSLLAYVMRKQGKYDDAERLSRLAVQGFEKVLGPTHPDSCTAASRLASTLAYQGKYDEAEQIGRRALEGHEQSKGPDHPNTITCAHDYGYILGEQGRFSEAEPYYRRALDARTKMDGPAHPGTLNVANNLALLLAHQGKYSIAEKMIRDVLRDAQKVLGADYSLTLLSQNNLCLILHDEGKYEEAEQASRALCESNAKVLGPEHPNTLIGLNNLAETLRQRDKLAEAEIMHRRVLELRSKVLGSAHPDTLMSMNNLSLVVHQLGKRAEAEELVRQAWYASEKALGLQHPDTLVFMRNTAGMMDERGDLDGAEPLYRRAWEARRAMLGPDHPETLTSLRDIALVLRKRGQKEESEKLHRQVLEAREKIFGSEHPDTLGSLWGLAAVVAAQAKYPEAEQIYRRLYLTYAKDFGPEHTDTLLSMGNLAWACEQNGKYDEAEPLLRGLHERKTSTVGPDDSSTLSVTWALGRLLRKQGKLDAATAFYERACIGLAHLGGVVSTRTFTCWKEWGLIPRDGEPQTQEPK